MKKRILAGLVAMVLATGLLPAAAFAASGDVLQAASQVSTQSNDLSTCTVKWTGSAFAGKSTATYQFFYVKGKTATVTPTFDLYNGSTKIDASNYEVSYKLSYWDDAKGEEVWKDATAPLSPSASPEAGEDSMASEYVLVIAAKSGSGYTDTNTSYRACVTDWYNVGRNMATYFSKAKSSWQYNINPMNGSYFVIPQAKAKATLNSLTLMAGCSPSTSSSGLNHDGTKVGSGNYTVSYYKAKKDAVAKNLSPASRAKTGKKLSKMPTTAGSYVMIIEGKGSFYGTASILFDVQDKAANVTVAKIKNQKYTGKAVKPKLTVKYKGTKLKAGTDYKVTYKNNKKKGTATAIIQGCNKIKTNPAGKIETLSSDRFFTGKKTVKFKIA